MRQVIETNQPVDPTFLGLPQELQEERTRGAKKTKPGSNPRDTQQVVVTTLLKMVLRNIEYAHQILMEQTSRGMCVTKRHDTMMMLEIARDLLSKMSVQVYADYDAFASDFVRVESLVRGLVQIYGGEDDSTARSLEGISDTLAVIFDVAEFTECEVMA